MFNQLLCAYVAEGVFQQDLAVVKPLSEIISDIRSQEYQDLVQAIQSSDNDEAKSLKLRLPTFYPALQSISSLEPTGIIQFDIDVKDNPTLDMGALAATLKNHPSTVYLFKSPRKGLKFGILTDFKNEENNNTDLLKKRFEFCYEDVLGQLSDLDGIQDFTPDKTASRIKQACFYSYDPDAYFNEFAEPLVVNELTPAISVSEYASKLPVHSAINNASSDFVEELLSFIPKDYSYHERMPINYAVCHLLGTEAGKRLLISHWSKPENILTRQIDSQMKYLKSSSIGVLINEAKKNGYRDTTGRARRKLEPKPSNVQLEPLLNAEQVDEKLNELISEFFTNQSNLYVSISAGAGKTRAVIKQLADASMSDKKVLYLVSNHQLGEQIEFNLAQEIKRRKAIFTSFCRDKFNNKNKIRRIRGKEPSKITQEEQKTWFDLSFEDDDEALLNIGSPYIDQFSSDANIRIMTHHEWFNTASVWAKGIKYELINAIELPNGELADDCKVSKSTSEDYWKPDYIIIDEDAIQLDGEIVRKTETMAFCLHDSIKLILKGLNQGKGLRELLEHYKSHVLADSKYNFPTNGSGKNRENNENYSEILHCFKMYIESKDEYWLKGIHYVTGELRINRVRQVQNRYRKVPTLILDATANESVINNVFPDFRLERISVQAKDDINLYQMCNANITKEYLCDEKKRISIINGLKSIACNYENVGLITYKSIDGIENFCEVLAGVLNIKQYAHFGNLRGLNSLSDVDCLLVVGRACLPDNVNREFAEAVFNIGSIEYERRHYEDRLFRMKSGEAKALSNLLYENHMLAAAYEHKSTSETIQAIGRGRLIHGKNKDIFLFSNESLGTDIEVTEFFRYEDYFQEPILDESIIRHLLEIGYVEKSRKGLAKVLLEAGLKVPGSIENYVKNHKEEIETELSLAGFRPTPSKSKYLVSDMLKFNQWLESVIH